jgi:hypothetical protein
MRRIVGPMPFIATRPAQATDAAPQNLITSIQAFARQQLVASARGRFGGQPKRKAAPPAEPDKGGLNP